MSWDKQKRVILPFLQRADEIEKFERKMAYYCRLFAVDQGIRIEERAPEADQLLGKVLGYLEAAKPYINLDPERDPEYCENFALGVFRNAENKDKSGETTRETAKGYYASSIFLEVLKQFGDLSEDLEQFRRYAIFRATEIKKALDKGEVVAPKTESREVAHNSSILDSAHLSSVNSGSSMVDPGYQPGMKVFFSEDMDTVKWTGTIKGRCADDNNTFVVESEDGSKANATLDQLAPDLPEQGAVLFTPEPGATTMEVKVVQVESTNIWPPMYIVETADGDQHACASKCLTLIPEKMPPATPMTIDLIRGPSRRKRSDERVSQSAAPEMNGRESPRPEAASTGGPQAYPLGDVSPIQRDASSPDDGATHREASLVGRLDGSNEYEAAASGEANGGRPIDAPKPSDPSTLVNAAPAVGVQQRALPRQQDDVRLPSIPSDGSEFPPLQGYTPDHQSIESAKKYARYAASSLGFDDVDSAVKYLNDALRLLTRPAVQ